MNKRDLYQISQFCTVVQSLKTLNISSNGLNITDFVVMFDILKPQTYNMTHLNLSWNTMVDSGTAPEVVESFRKKFADFLRYSRTLQHIELSGIHFSEESLKYITLYGFRKSKTLLSIHMSGNFEKHSLLLKFREWMKVVKVERKVSRDEPVNDFFPPNDEPGASDEKAILELTSSNQARTPVDPADQTKEPIGLVELENMLREK